MIDDGTSLNQARQLVLIGQAIRQRRIELGVTAVATAEAASISRVTLHRIEKGESTVSIGAYVSVASALNLTLDLQTANETNPGVERVASVPMRISLDKYPQLRELAWHMPGASHLSPAEAYSLYVRNQRFLEPERLTGDEQTLIRQLEEIFEGAS